MSFTKYNMRSYLPPLVYVSGPISDAPDHVKEFREAVDFLKHDGHRVLDPLSIPASKDILSERKEWVYYMKRAVKLLMGADGIYMLEGWEKSEGASLEHQLAKDLDIPIHYASEDHKYV